LHRHYISAAVLTSRVAIRYPPPWIWVWLLPTGTSFRLSFNFLPSTDACSFATVYHLLLETSFFSLRLRSDLVIISTCPPPSSFGDSYALLERLYTSNARARLVGIHPCTLSPLLLLQTPYHEPAHYLEMIFKQPLNCFCRSTFLPPGSWVTEIARQENRVALWLLSFHLAPSTELSLTLGKIFRV
jgi:hypothetical protein